MFVNGIYVDTFHWGVDRYAYLSQLIDVGATKDAASMPETLTVNETAYRLTNGYHDPEDRARADEWRYEPVTVNSEIAYFIVINNLV
jgi:hypothetical protein